MFFSHQIRTYLPELKENFWRILFAAALLLPAVQGVGQQNTAAQPLKTTPFYQLYEWSPTAAGGRLLPAAPFTSLAVSLSDSSLFEGLYVVVEADTLLLRPAAHQPENAEGIVSDLLVFDEPQQAVLLPGLSGKEIIQLHLMYAPPFNKEAGANLRRQYREGCEEPAAVPQAVWREGLPEPQYTRSFTTVEHLVVHHSATSNQADNYTQLVRNIYLYHTQTNGWSDIGYNYLVAPDGTLFAGRDPGPAGAQDRVVGAHFCGKNSSTMGVCLLGNFMEVAPSASAIQTLEELLSWKAYKENLEPLAESPHPANPSLPVIAGHRNGCATACPGDYLYALLPQVRQDVQAAVESCNEPEEEMPFVYADPQTREFCFGGMQEREVERIRIYTLAGKRITPKAFRLPRIVPCGTLPELAPGIYIIVAEGEDWHIRQKILVL